MDEMEVFPLQSDQGQPAQKPFLNKVNKLLKDKHSGPPLKELQKLLYTAMDNLPAAFLDNYSPGDFVGFLEFIYEEINKFSSGETEQLKLINPSPETNSWSSPFTVVNLVTADLPFVVDSLEANLQQSGLEIQHIFYSRFSYSYDSQMETTVISPENDGKKSLLLVNLQLNRQNDSGLAKIRQTVEKSLEELKLAVSDFEEMTARARKISELITSYQEILPNKKDLLSEARRFLDFVINENFVFLGYREYQLKSTEDEQQLKTVPGSNLGILKQERFTDYKEAVPVEELEFRVQERVTSRMILTVKKTEAKSHVYRAEQLDHITIKNLDESGNICGEYQLVGLFTDRVLNEPAVNIPLLRKKFQDLIDRENITKHTHLYRDVYTIYNNMPKHLLFMSPVEDLIEDIRAIVEAYGKTGFKLRARPDAYHQGLTIMVILSRKRYNERIGREIQSELEKEFSPEGLDYRITFGESDFVQLHYYLQTDRRNPKTCSFDELEERLQELSRSWEDRLTELITEKLPEKKGRAVKKIYPEALPDDYQAHVSPETALRDIQNLEKIRKERTTSAPVIDLSLKQDSPEESQLIFYSPERIKLNEIMPMLSNHGLQILEQSTFKTVIEENEYYLHLFLLEEPQEAGVNFERRRDLLLRSIKGVYNEIYRDDLINRLIISRGLSPRSLNLFRLYKNYFHQITPAIKLESINKALIKHDRITAALFRYFEIKFDPDQPLKNRETELQEQKSSIEDRLETIEDRNEHYILSTIFNLLDATVRTNYYQENCEKSYISVKIESATVEEMPEPRPLFEIYVYSTVMEAIHLRHSKIARGGIRWSDRRDDFRTEVLGLVKTQQVKNGLIVPGGSKGGFVLKQEHLSDEQELARHARGQYRIFMDGLLDLTDNLVNGEVKRPEDVLCYDEPDPYLVVAADKGTAQFSDTANEVSAEHDFWLGDAFATGGSTGYDHKELGITAKGAWECVKRHFRELEKDIQNNSFTVVGIGDMSGDVFGNGMLLSRQIKLVGAFNHKHIFINPDPDPDNTFEERKRLYESELGWDHYDSSILSRGGHIYKREARTLELSEEARDLLGFEKIEQNPEVVIRALLNLDVDLLWNGGIGTYIKATDEPHSAADDPSNDSCRVDAGEVQASVIGEGGNLGITQKGRIELDRRGVKLNTDALDNSGGVDLSDHEVNIKILLQESIKQGELKEEDRLEVLGKLPDNLIKKVTDNNYRQSGVISLEAHNSERRLDAYRHLLTFLETNYDLNRKVEDLPGESEMLERVESNQGMTRPELAVMLSYAKMYLYDQAKEAEWEHDWAVAPFLEQYFPDLLLDNFPKGLREHPLKKEIALTALINYLVDNCGITFFFRLQEETGASVPAVLNWYLAADRLANAENLREMLREKEQDVSAEVYYTTWWEITKLLNSTVLWLHESVRREWSPRDFTDNFTDKLAQKRQEIMNHLDPERDQRIATKQNAWLEKGLNPEFNEKMSEFYYLLPALDILLVESNTNAQLEKISSIYFELGSLLNIDWLMNRLLHEHSHDHWQQLATNALSREINTIQRNLVTNLIKSQTSPEDFQQANKATFCQLNSISKELSSDRKLNFPGFQFYVQHLRHLG